MYAVVDCDNCFVSCERVFQPELLGKPVVVLSNNDGCVVARSNEAKALGIKMGVPIYQIKDLCTQHDVQIRSSNYILYADMSNRVMSILRDEVGPGRLEQYSIDEAFLSIELVFDYRQWGEALVKKIGTWTGMPVSIGMAPTRTLAKAAVWFAKKWKGYNKVCIIENEEQREKALKSLPIEEVWGIGWRGKSKCDYYGIKNAFDFTEKSESWVRKLFTITGVRTWRELKGQSSIESVLTGDKQTICTSRSFDGMEEDKGKLEMYISNYAAHCAQKVRAQKSVCSMVTVFLQTNHFREDLPQHDAGLTVTLLTPASSTNEIVKAALRAFRACYKVGFQYKRAGVIVSGITKSTSIQQNLFDELTPEQRQKFNKLSEVMDTINRRMGNDTMILGVQQFPKDEKTGEQLNFRDLIKHDHRSKCYTTDINELIEVK
jgi:DNA polymerase V